MFENQSSSGVYNLRITHTYVMLIFRNTANKTYFWGGIILFELLPLI